MTPEPRHNRRTAGTPQPGTDASDPMVRPPRLRTGEGRSASRLELFFDLAYVLVVAELASALLAHPDPMSALRFAGLFTLIWLSWTGFTLYANRFDTDDLILRLAKLIAMLGVLGCAASAAEATSTHLTAFTLSYLLGRLVLTLLYLRAWRHVTDARPTIAIYVAGHSIVLGLWAGSLLVPTPGGYWMWGAAALVDLATPVIATHRHNRVPLHLEHLPERFGLLVILVLGEVTAAIVTGVHEAQWAGRSVLVAVLGFVVAAAGWWVYFDVGGTVSTRALQRAEDAHPDSKAEEQRLDERHDLFIHGHLPTTLGIVLAGVGLEQLVLHPTAGFADSGGWLLVTGLDVFLLGCTVIVGGSLDSVTHAAGWPGAGCMALSLLGVILILTNTACLPALAVLAAALGVIAATGTWHTRTT